MTLICFVGTTLSWEMWWLVESQRYGTVTNMLLFIISAASHCKPDASQVANKRWRIDLKSRQAAALMLSGVNLPGGVQV